MGTERENAHAHGDSTGIQSQASHPHRDPRELYRLLLEELARGGIEVVFTKEAEWSGAPEDELLRQLQGMFAEYERARIAERCHRRKLHWARAGAVSVLGHAPYGYRCVKRSQHADACDEIDELEAPIVREIFDRYVEQRASIAGAASGKSRGARGHLNGLPIRAPLPLVLDRLWPGVVT